MPRLKIKLETCVTTAQPSQLRVSIVVKLFNCVDAMGRNVSKQSRIWRHTFLTNSFILSYFTRMNNYYNIRQFLILTGVGFYG